ncbi:MAG: AsmA family protein, partial [Candidatus Margulisiibacteriota bacterium]
MKKLFKWIGITAGILVVLLIIGVVALPLIFPLEKIKDYAVSRISETIHREVKIEKVSFNIFEGVKLEKLSIGNRAGFSNQPFVTADAISLRYAFWPLFWRQIIIKEVRLVNPQVLVEKNARGEFNFSDMFSPAERKTQDGSHVPTAGRSTDLPFNLIID